MPAGRGIGTRGSRKWMGEGEVQVWPREGHELRVPVWGCALYMRGGGEQQGEHGKEGERGATGRGVGTRGSRKWEEEK